MAGSSYSASVSPTPSLPNGSPSQKTAKLAAITINTPAASSPRSTPSSSPKPVFPHPRASPTLSSHSPNGVNGRHPPSPSPTLAGPGPHFLGIDDRGFSTSAQDGNHAGGPSAPASLLEGRGQPNGASNGTATSSGHSTERPTTSGQAHESMLTTTSPTSLSPPNPLFTEATAGPSSGPSTSHTSHRRRPSEFSIPSAEDSLSSHVRQVYHRLDLVGVKGDGWAEGVERTRERRGTIRRKSRRASMVQGGEQVPEIDEDENESAEEEERVEREEARQTGRATSSSDAQSRALIDQELAILQHTDRFGFFEDSHSKGAAHPGGGPPRVSLLPRQGFLKAPGRLPIKPSRGKAKAEAKRSEDAQEMPTSPTLISPPDFSVIKGSADPSDPSSRSPLPSSSASVSVEKETSRISKWSDMLSVSSRDVGHNAATYDLAPEWQQSARKLRKFEGRVWKGIPDRWRRAGWEVLIRGFGEPQRWGTPWSDDLRRSKSARPVGGAREERDEKAQMGKRYRELVDTPSRQDVQIDLDVPRTISGHVLFHTRYGKGQRALFHVLHAWGLHCEECGYCQGMGPIAATFLSYYEPETAYACVTALHDRYGLHEIFRPGFPGLVECFYLQERLIETLMPDVHKVFESQMISSSAYATKWYITLFSTTIPFSAQLRLWDALLLEGKDLLVIASVSIIWTFRARLLSSSATFETILSLLSCYFVVEDEEVWLRWMQKVAKRTEVRESMKKWRKEWKGFVEDGTAQSRMT